MTTLLQDLKYGLRMLAKNPSFTAVVVVSIAIGIAANVTAFSIVNGLFLGDLPVKEPERLVSFSNSRSDFSYPDYLDYRDQTRQVFEDISATFPLAPASLGGSGEPERLWGQLVSGNFFSVMGANPVVGRGFTPEEDKVPGRDAVVVISHSLWQRRPRSSSRRAPHPFDIAPLWIYGFGNGVAETGPPRKGRCRLYAGRARISATKGGST